MVEWGMIFNDGRTPSETLDYTYLEFEGIISSEFWELCRELNYEKGLHIIEREDEQGVCYFLVLIHSDKQCVGMVKIYPSSTGDIKALFDEDVAAYTSTIFLNPFYRVSTNEGLRQPNYLDLFLRSASEFVSQLDTDKQMYLIEDVIVPQTDKFSGRFTRITKALRFRNYEARFGRNNQVYYVKRIK